MEVQIYYPGGDADPSAMRGLARSVMESFPAAQVSVHDYSSGGNYRRMRELEKLAGVKTPADVQAFILLEDAPPLALLGEANVLQRLMPLLEELVAVLAPEGEGGLLETARGVFPAADAIVPVYGEYLYTVRSSGRTLGYIADVFVPPDCPTCSAVGFVMVFDASGVIRRAVSTTTVIESGRRVDPAPLLNRLTGIGDAGSISPSNVPAIPDAKEASRLFLIGARTAIMDVAGLVKGSGR